MVSAHADVYLRSQQNWISHKRNEKTRIWRSQSWCMIIENQRVKSWLINSTSPLLMERFIRLSTAKEIWETEIDHRTTSQEGTVEGLIQLHSTMARLRVHIFLRGLDSEFDQFRGKILRKDPKLDLESTYAYVRREYQQRQTMGSNRPISENLATLVNQTRQGYQAVETLNPLEKPTTRYSLTVGKKDIRNNVVTRLLAIRSGGTSHKNLVKRLLGKPWQHLPKNNCASDHMMRDSSQLKFVLPSPQSVISTTNDILTRKILGYGVRRGKLYYLELTENGGSKISQANQASSKDSAQATICLNKSFEPFEVIHSDVWGPTKVPSISRAHYFLTFIDECTRMTWYQKQIRVLQSDNGTEFVDVSLRNFLNNHGIRHQTSCTYILPQQNGLAKRKNRQLLGVVRTSLFDMNMPQFYWGEAVKFVAYLINRTPS
ncbi:uncharacterized protein [Aristolochia californica]|uniref:uncharacterized protein n=1 Tax=Aristolochia californica TaxID=171875 RepID=UPI0035DBF5C6